MNSTIITIQELPIRLHDAFVSYDNFNATDVPLPNVTGLHPDEAAYLRIGFIIKAVAEQRYIDAIRTLVAYVSPSRAVHGSQSNPSSTVKGQSCLTDTGCQSFADYIELWLTGINEDTRVFYSRANHQILLGFIGNILVGYQPDSFITWCLEALSTLTLFCIMRAIPLPVQQAAAPSPSPQAAAPSPSPQAAV